MGRKILIVDDEVSVRQLLMEIVRKEGFIVETAENGQEALNKMRQNSPDLVIMDIRMPVMSGLEALDIIRAEKPNLLVILLTAYGTVDTAVEAMQRGAFDYLVKPANIGEIRATINRVMTMLNLRDEVDPVNLEPGGIQIPDKIIGRSATMQNLYKIVGKIAKSSATVLITGESGSGKELIAKTIHANSTRTERPFVSINCGALPETLIENELFGHEKGAFTGAGSLQLGRFELADGGTLFLDEIGDLPFSLQSKLLRVLQENEFERIGGAKTIKVDVRVIAATNRNLAEMVKEKTFRSDLFYRLNVVPLRVPPLRERKEDIPLLVEHFVKKYAKKHHCLVPLVTPAALRALTEYEWPGNVRELANLLERTVVLAQGVLDIDDFSFNLSWVDDYIHPNNFITEILNNNDSLKDMLAAVERIILVKVMSEQKGNRSRTAQRLKVSRRTLLYKLQEHRLTDTNIFQYHQNDDEIS